MQQFNFIYLFCLFRATPVAYGKSQARGWIGATLLAYTRTTAMRDPSHICDLHHTSQQHWILNPLSEARDRTPSWMLVEFVSAAPQWEFPHCFLNRPAAMVPGDVSVPACLVYKDKAIQPTRVVTPWVLFSVDGSVAKRGPRSQSWSTVRSPEDPGHTCDFRAEAWLACRWQDFPSATSPLLPFTSSEEQQPHAW